MEACTNGTLADEDVKFSDGAAACVILASGGYPEMCIRDRPGRDVAIATEWGMWQRVSADGEGEVVIRKGEQQWKRST